MCRVRDTLSKGKFSSVIQVVMGIASVNVRCSNNNCLPSRCRGIPTILSLFVVAGTLIEPLSGNGRCFPGNQLPIWLHYFSFQTACYIAPSSRLFVPNSLTVYHRSFLPRAELATFVIGLNFLPVARVLSFFCRVSPFTTTTAPSLGALVPNGTLIGNSLFSPGFIIGLYFV
jgi:hypothetical protein